MKAAGEVRLARQWAGTGMGVRIWVGMARALVGDRERVRKKGRVLGLRGRGLGGSREEEECLRADGRLVK